jgi:cleavage and polyadenylation specificity factor subunit 1
MQKYHVPFVTLRRRLKEYKDTLKLIIFTLDLVAHSYPVITTAESLPYDCISLVPCATTLGGVVIMASNAIIYIDQASRRVTLPINGWPARTSDMPLPSLSVEEQRRYLELEGCRSAFVDDKTLFVILKSGIIHPVEIVADGKNVSKLVMAPALAQATVPTVTKKLTGDYLFVGSTTGSSVLLKASHIEEEIEEEHDLGQVHTAVVDVDDSMDLDDDDG